MLNLDHYLDSGLIRCREPIGLMESIGNEITGGNV